jgi:hypothetical protein
MHTHALSFRPQLHSEEGNYLRKGSRKNGKARAHNFSQLEKSRTAKQRGWKMRQDIFHNAKFCVCFHTYTMVPAMRSLFFNKI